MTRRILSAIAILMALTSCRWVSGTENTPLQPKLNEELRGRYAENVLDYFGFPDNVRADSLNNVETFMYHYSDSMTFKYTVGYEALTDHNPPFVDVYMVEGKVFWVKTNLAKPVISHDEWLLSVTKIASCTGALLFIALLFFLTLLLTRRKDLNNLHESIDKLVDKIKLIDEDSLVLREKADKLNADLSHFLAMEEIVDKLNDNLSRLDKALVTFSCKYQDTSKDLLTKFHGAAEAIKAALTFIQSKSNEDNQEQKMLESFMVTLNSKISQSITDSLTQWTDDISRGMVSLRENIKTSQTSGPADIKNGDDRREKWMSKVKDVFKWGDACNALVSLGYSKKYARMRTSQDLNVLLNKNKIIKNTEPGVYSKVKPDSKEKSSAEAMKEPKQLKPVRLNKRQIKALARPIGANLNRELYMGLKNAGVLNMGLLCSCSAMDIKKQLGIGDVTMKIIERIVDSAGLSLGMDLTAYGYHNPLKGV